MEKSGNSTRVKCAVCRLKVPAGETRPMDELDDELLDLICANSPALRGPGQFICLVDIARFRRRRVQQELAGRIGQANELQREVIESLDSETSQAEHKEAHAQPAPTRGQRLADTAAAFGGSWTFLLLFGLFLALWIVLNSTVAQDLDPFPFILLNLFLSCIAAIQAPVIMMSQNRQELKDRIRGENDYRTDLKAELEIRSLHSKVDLLLTHQMQRLNELEDKHNKILEELAALRGGRA